MGAVPVEEDGLYGVPEVGARGVESHRDWALPPLQERLQVGEEGEVAVGGEGHRLIVCVMPGAHHVVVEDPAVLSQSLKVSVISGLTASLT